MPRSEPQGSECVRKTGAAKAGSRLVNEQETIERIQRLAHKGLNYSQIRRQTEQ
jgi:hypothetical protein